MTAYPGQLPEPTPAAAGAGAVIWITGLSGAGKSTVAAELVPRLAAAGQRPILLDGDQLRAVLDADGYDEVNRRRLAFRYARLCRLLANQGHIVICATIALFHDVQAWNRANLPNYLEIFLDVPVTELRRRNSKGLYRLGDGRDVVGVGIPAEFPASPDLVVSNQGATTPAAVAADIIRLYRTRGSNQERSSTNKEEVSSID